VNNAKRIEAQQALARLFDKAANGPTYDTAARAIGYHAQNQVDRDLIAEFLKVDADDVVAAVDGSEQDRHKKG